jgi:hypothetical protein
METETDPRKLKDCAHCRVNPKATEPFLKMKKLPVGGKVLQDLQKTAKINNEQPECYLCGLVEDMVNGLEQAFKE